MTKLSVNINKIATIRNARGGNTPNLIQMALDAERFGADGITVHPRPDERHITRQDVYDLKQVLTKEFNIEGYPSKEFIKLVLDVKPAQVTLVPDGPDVLTSNAGWNVTDNFHFLSEVILELRNHDIRTSIFIDTNLNEIEQAKKVGTDRIELYTESYASNYDKSPKKAIDSYVLSSELASKIGLGINAGHDLSLINLQYFSRHIPNLLEVSIGHALISDSLYYGFENAINMYKDKLRP